MDFDSWPHLPFACQNAEIRPRLLFSLDLTTSSLCRLDAERRPTAATKLGSVEARRIVGHSIDRYEVSNGEDLSFAGFALVR
jgi:hypothetical protein